MNCLYKITNIKNGKIYFGKTNNLNLRFSKHKTLPFSKNQKLRNAIPKLYASIRKYGIDNFIFESVAYFENVEDCFIVEKFFIKQFDTIKFGYNISEGGTGQSVGFKHSLLSNEKNRLAHLGERNHFYGKTHSQESIKQMRESHKNKALKGEENKNSKTNEQQVREIRHFHKEKLKTLKEISIEYDLGISTIKDIIYFKTWKHVI